MASTTSTRCLCSFAAWPPVATSSPGERRSASSSRSRSWQRSEAPVRPLRASAQPTTRPQPSPTRRRRTPRTPHGHRCPMPGVAARSRSWPHPARAAVRTGRRAWRPRSAPRSCWRARPLAFRSAPHGHPQRRRSGCPSPHRIPSSTSRSPPSAGVHIRIDRPRRAPVRQGRRARSPCSGASGLRAGGLPGPRAAPAPPSARSAGGARAPARGHRRPVSAIPPCERSRRWSRVCTSCACPAPNAGCHRHAPVSMDTLARRVSGGGSRAPAARRSRRRPRGCGSGPGSPSRRCSTP